MGPKQKMLNRHVLFWGALLILSSIFILTYLIIFGNTDQVFTDIVIESVSLYASNKSVEMRLLYLLILAGSVACVLWHIHTKQHASPVRLQRIEDGPELLNFMFCAILSFAVGYFVIFQETNPLLLAAVFLVIILFCVDKELIMPGICTFAVIAYAVLALYRIYAAFGGEASINYMTVTVLSALMIVIPLVRQDKKRALLRASLICQLLIPCLLLVFTQSKYRYHGEIVTIAVPAAVLILVTVLMAGFLAEALYRCYKQWKNPTGLSDAICIGTCFAVMAFNFFIANGAVLKMDIHHAFERVIGYSEIFQLGMVPFRDYIPVSGMYSVPYGAVFQLFGNGLLSNFNVTTNVYFSLIILLTVVLLCVHLKRSYVLLISVYLCFPDYNQYAFILPIMLLLSSPKLIGKKNRWLKVWFFTSFLYGLYYPVYGTAVCAAFIPLGIWQIVTYISSGELKRDVKTIGFWVWWLICVIPVILSIPMLIGTFRHILTMAGQSVFSDGIARFGQEVSGSILPYMSGYPAVRSAFLYIITFLVPALYVWVSLSATLQAGGVSLEGKRIRVERKKETCLGLAMVIMPPIAYTYSAIRTDINSMYARSLGVLLAGGIVLIVYVHHYLQSKTGRYAAYCIAFLIAVSSPSLGFTDNEAKMTAIYEVPDGYVYVNKDPVEKVGEGFIASSIYDDIRANWEVAQTLDRDRTYFGKFLLFGHYYLFDVKGAASVELSGSVRGFGAATEAAEVVQRTNSIIGTQMDTMSYYFYNWVLTSGKYRWSADDGVFLPVKETMDHELTKVFNKNVDIGRGDDIGQSSSSFGSSFDSLQNLFSDPGIDLDIQPEATLVSMDFSKMVDGDDADFLYLEFGDMLKTYKYVLFSNNGEEEQHPSPLFQWFTKKHYNPDDYVTVSWTDDDGEPHSMRCAMGKGKLLIPLGGGVKWLLHDHDNLTVTVDRNGEQVEVPEIVSAKLLKLREVQ